MIAKSPLTQPMPCIEKLHTQSFKSLSFAAGAPSVFVSFLFLSPVSGESIPTSLALRLRAKQLEGLIGAITMLIGFR